MSRLLGGASVAALTLLASPVPTHAQTPLYWDANGPSAGSGGSGNWATSTQLWSQSNSDVLGPYVAWTNNPANPNDALFGLTAAGTTTTVGTITLAEPIDVHNLTFQTVNNWVISGSTLTLGGTTPTLAVNATTQIDSVIAGSGFTKTGGGLLTLTGVNTFTGDITLSGGTLHATTDAALGAAGNSLLVTQSSTLTIDSGSTARTVTITGGTLNLGGAGNGAQRITGAGNIVVTNGVALTNNASDYTGTTVFAGCNGHCAESFSSIANLGVASALGAPTTVANGTITWNQASQYLDSVIYTGAGDSSDRNWVINTSGRPDWGALLRNQGTGTLTLTGAMTVNGTMITFLPDTADIDLQGVISGPSGVTITATAPHVVTLGAANTYTGDTTITGGKAAASIFADAGVASSLGAGSTVNLGANGTLSYIGSGGSSNRAFTASGAVGIWNEGTGAVALSGPLSFTTGGPADSLTFGGSYAGTSTYSGVISGAGDIASTGGTTWLLTGANTRTGAVTVDGGTLRAGGASAFGTLTGVTVNGGMLDLNDFSLATPTLNGAGGAVALGINPSTVLTVNGAAASPYGGSITGAGGLTKTGTGSLTLTGASTYTGATTVGGGTLALDFSAVGSNVLPSASALVMAGGALTMTGSSSQDSVQTFSGTTVAAGSNQIVATAAGGHALTINLGVISHTGGLMDFNLNSGAVINTASPDGALGWATVNGSDYAEISGGAITALTTYANKDDASTWVNADVVSDAANAADTPYTGTVTGSVELGGLKYTAAADSTVIVGGGNTLGVDGVIIVSPTVANASQTITGGSIRGAAGATLGVLQNSTGTGSLTIASTIVDNGGPTGFVQGGTGQVTLTGSNTYTGPTTLSGGTLTVGSIADGGVASSIGQSLAASSNLVIENGTLQYTGTTASSNRGFTLVNGGPSRTISVTDGAADLTFSGVVTSTDGASLTKTGPGVLTLANAANDYGGATTVSGGLLSVGTLTDGGVASGIGAADPSSANLVLQTGGGLQYTGGSTDIDRGFTLASGTGVFDVSQAGTTLAVDGAGVGPGQLVKNGAGTLVLGGLNTFAGGGVINTGMVQAGSAQAFGTGGWTVASGATLDLNGFDDTIRSLSGAGTLALGAQTLTLGPGGNPTFSGNITGTGALIVNGGAQTFSGCNNSYTGPTTLQGATALNVDCLNDGGQPSAIGASSNASASLAFNNGALNYSGGTIIIDRGFQLTANIGAIGVSTVGTTLTMTGQAVGAGQLRKDGPGALVLTGANTYTGGTTITGGLLKAGSASAFGTNFISLQNNAGVTVDVNGFDVSASFVNGGGTNGGNIALSGGGSLTLTNPGGAAIYAGAISGDGSLILSSVLTENLTGCNSSYTGSTVLNAGVIAASCLSDGGANSSIGAATVDPGNLVLNGGTLRYTGAGDSTNRQFTLGSSSTSALDASGTGAIVFTSTAPIAFSSPNTAQSVTLTGTSPLDNKLGLQVTDNGTGKTGLSKTGVGTWILTNSASTYTGVTSVTGGVLGVDKLTDGLSASSLGASSNAAANLIIGSGATLRYTGAGDHTDRQFTLGVGSTSIESSGTGAVEFSNTAAISYSGNGARVVSLGGTYAGDNIMGATIGDQSASNITSLAKSGAGTWILTGADTYTGVTNINAGTLILGNGGATGSIASQTVNDFGVLGFNRDNYVYGGVISQTGSVRQIGTGTTVLTAANTYTGATDVMAGTLRINGDQSAATGLTTVFSGATLGGSGVIGGSVVVQNGGALSPGNSPGTMTINGDLTLNSSSVLTMEFGQANIVGGSLNDLIQVNGNLTLDGTINVTVPTGGAFTAGVYRIANYTGALTDNGLNLGTMPGGASTFLQTAVTGQVNLVNNAGQTLYFWDGPPGPKNDGVIQGGTGTWRLADGVNAWTDPTGTANSDFGQNGFAVFEGAPGTVTVDGSGGAVGVSGLQFAVDGYTIAGDGLTLAAAQTPVRVGDGTPAGAGMTATIGSVLSGPGQLVKTDAGTLVLSGTNTYTGGTAIDGGVLSISSDANLGDAAGGLGLDGGTLHLTSGVTLARSVTLGAGGGTVQADAVSSVSGAITGEGGLTKIGASALTLTGTNSYSGGTIISAGTLALGNGAATGSITGDVLDNALLTFNNPGVQTFDGTISGSGQLRKVNTGTEILTAANTYAGATTVASGTLLINGDQSGATGLTTVSGGVLGGSGTVGGDVTIAAGAALAPGGAAGAPGTLTVKGGLILADATSSLNYAFGQPNVPGGALNDLLKVGGDVALGGATINVTSSAPSFGPGLYRVIDYAGTRTGTLSLGSMPAGASFSVQTSVDKQVNLVNSAGLALDIWDGDAGGRNDGDIAGGAGTWQGGGAGGNDNWTLADGSVNAPWADAAFAVFTKTGGAVTVDATTAGPINVSGMQFAVDGYAIGGDAVNLVGPSNIWVGDGTSNSAAITAVINSALAGTGQLIKTDAGTLVLTGANSYTGGTQVNGGTLVVNGDQTAATGLAVVNDGGTLAGSGVVGGGVTVADGGAIAPGQGGVGALTIQGPLVLNAGSALNMEFGVPDTVGGTLNDLITVNGNLTLDGTLNVAQSAGGAFGPGIYRVIDYTGALTDNGLSLGALPSGVGTVQTSIANQVNLVVAAAPPSGGPSTYTFWDSGGMAADGRVSGGNGTWTVAPGQAWTGETGADNGGFANGGFAVFAGSPGVVTVDNGPGAVSVSGMQFAADGYLVQGDAITLPGPEATLRVGDGTSAGAAFTATIEAPLTGDAQLVKTDGGALVLTGANTYSGGTTISGGTLQLGIGGATGSIVGDVTDNGVLAFDRSDSTAFSGVISGSGGVRQRGQGTTTLAATNTYAGGTRIDAGALAGSAASFGSGAIFDNATLIFDQAADASFANAIDGAGALVKTGAGALTYAGTATLSGPTTVAAGALLVDGSLAASPVTVKSGALLGGSGTVGAAALQAGAAVSPGEGIGTLTVNGAYQQAGGSTYQVEIDPKAGVYDRIVVSGAAALGAGAVLDVKRVGSGMYAPGDVYTVLTAAGGVSGTYDLTGDIAGVSAFLALRANYDPTEVQLTVVQDRAFTAAASTPNQAASAAAADGLPVAGDLKTALLNLSADGDAQAAFDRLSGEVHAALKGVLVGQSEAVRAAVLGRMSDVACGRHDDKHENLVCPDDKPAGWAQALGGWGRVDGDGNAAGLDQSSSGFLIGVDAPIGAWRAGAFGGYTRSNFSLGAERGSGASDDYHFGAYGGRQWRALGLRLGADYTRYDIETGRSAVFPGFAQALGAFYKADGGEAFADLAYRLSRGRMALEPFANIAHVILHTDRFTETGGSAALAGGGETMQTTIATLGVRPQTTVDLGSTRATLRGLVGWRHAFDDVDPRASLAFASGGDGFQVHGAPIARDAAAVEAGLEVPFAENGQVSFSYGGQFGGGTTDQRVRLDIRLRF